MFMAKYNQTHARIYKCILNTAILCLTINHKQEKLRRWPGAGQAQVCCQRLTDDVHGDRVTEGKKDWKRLGGNVVLKKLWPDSTGGRSYRSPRPVGALLPTAHSCSAMPQHAAVPRLLGGCSNIYHSCGFLLLFAFPSFSCNRLLFPISFPSLQIPLGCIFLALMSTCQPLI